MNLGVCYYPEHWPEDTWQPDAARMKDIGLSWVRIGEFAWSRLEPSPGNVQFDWLDRAIDTLGRAGLKVVLGTPTPTPPKWLMDKYDDVLQVGADGHPRRFGSRRHYCFNSASYRQESERIVTLLAERYGTNESVQAWQTDNEYGCHGTVRCYCPNCEAAFRVWLQEKYANIEALNEAWWNVFWSMEYSNFNEIDLPNLTVTEAHPSHSLDYYRFASDSVVDYNRLQTRIIRQYSSKPITHNVMLYFADFDHYKLAEDLDIVTWDNYPLGMLEMSPLPDDVKAHFLRTGHPDLISLIHDLYYGLKRKPFWVMEQQPGQVNWAPSNPIPAPGVVRLWSHQAFAHGADTVAYFRWRAALGAQELMHAGLNKHDGSPDQATLEAKQVHADLLSPLLKSATAAFQHEVALLFDYENLWATELQPHATGWDYWYLQMAYYTALRELGISLTLAHPRADLSAFKVVIAPALHLVDDTLAEHLSHYVRGGGQLVIGPRSGAKTLSNIAHAPAPGPLSELMGVQVDRVDALRPGISETILLDESALPYSTWADLLVPTDAQVLATYETPAYKGVAAVTNKTHGTGTCTTIGMWSEAAVLKILLKPVLKAAAISSTELPFGTRITDRGNLRYLLNFNPNAETLLGEQLEPFDVKIIDS